MFSFVPPLRITGEFEDSVQSDIAETIKVAPHELTISIPQAIVDKHDCPPTFRIFAFNQDHIHEKIDPETIPYEIASLASVELFDDLARKTNSYVVFHNHERPTEGYLRLFLGEFLPFAVRSPRKTLYERVFQLLPVSGQLFAHLDQGGEPYEEYIENALVTFRDHVIEPTRETVEEALEFGIADLQRTEVLRGNVMKALDRATDLISIVADQTSAIGERARGFTRLVLPFLHSYTIRSLLSDYAELTKSTARVALRITQEKEIPAKDIFEVVQQIVEAE
ncbi:MAG: hypothetical protein ACXACI_12685 [Candidatus Hodarchaeales archaeon]|jgi:hypothetical protein